MLGHSSATLTLGTCGHLFEDRLDEVGDAMDLVLPQCCPRLKDRDRVL
jgi:hypothetical protein